MRDRREFERVQQLAAAGHSDYAIARRLRMPRSTVQNWRHRRSPPGGRSYGAGAKRWRPSDRGAYAYLLGLYLGDGHLVHSSERSWRLAIYLDQLYPEIVEEARRAVLAVLPGVAVRVNPRPGAKVLLASSAIWPQAFPQHGPGKKHERPIVLRRWQAAITRDHPEGLLRGLIHSDGCRTVNRFCTKLPSGRVAEYAYPRYFFTNESADIRAIFCRHCEVLGIRWTRSNRRNISVSHRASVALLDSFVGRKR